MGIPAVATVYKARSNLIISHQSSGQLKTAWRPLLALELGCDGMCKKESVALRALKLDGDVAAAGFPAASPTPPTNPCVCPGVPSNPDRMFIVHSQGPALPPLKETPRVLACSATTTNIQASARTLRSCPVCCCCFRPMRC